MTHAIVNRVKTFLEPEGGPTATEHVIMLALIIVVVIGSATALGSKVSALFSNA